MYFALIDTDGGDVLDWFDELEAAYEAAETTEDAEVVAFTAAGRPIPPPPRIQRASYIYGEVEVHQEPLLALSGETERTPSPFVLGAA